MALVDEDLRWTMENLVFLEHNSVVQTLLGISSLLIAFRLFYIVVKWTPDEMASRRTSVLIQLITCVVHSIVYSFTQSIPLIPHKALISTSPFRKFNCFPSTLLFIAWISNLSLSATSALSSSISHYLGLMEGMRQSNRILDTYAGLSHSIKKCISFFAHLISVILIGLSIFISMDLQTDADGPYAVYLRSNFAMIRMKSSNAYLVVLGSSFVIFLSMYIFQLFYLKKAVEQQLERIKPSISPRTWHILQYTARLFLAIAVQPIVSFFLPIALFIIFQFFVMNIIHRSKITLNLITWAVTALLSLHPFAFYILTLVSFKAYRYHFFLIFHTPLTLYTTYRQRRVAVVHSDSNKEGV